MDSAYDQKYIYEHIFNELNAQAIIPLNKRGEKILLKDWIKPIIRFVLGVSHLFIGDVTNKKENKNSAALM